MKKTYLTILYVLTLLIVSCRGTSSSNNDNIDKSDSIAITESPDTLDFPTDEIQVDPKEVAFVASDDGNIKIYTWNPNPNGFYGYSFRCKVRSMDGKAKIVEIPFDLDSGTVTKIHTLKKKDGSTYYLLELYYRTGGMRESDLVAVRLENDELVPVNIFDGSETPEDQGEMSVEYGADWYFGEGREWIYEYDKATKTLYSPLTTSVKKDEDDYVYFGIADRYDEYYFNGDKLVLVHKDQPNRRLHKSLAKYVYAAAPFRTKDFNIRIDGMADGSFRYASWKIDNPMSSKPEVIIYGGKQYDDYSYSFTNEGYEYIVNKEIPSKLDSYTHKYLLVKKEGKILLKQEIISF